MYVASDFDYELPDALIAQVPTQRRGESRLLVVPADQSQLIDASFADFDSRLRAGDLLVINDTRVLPARLFGEKTLTGGKVELMLERIEDAKSATMQIRASKSPGPGTGITTTAGTELRVMGRQGPFFRIERTDGGAFIDLLEEEGHIPLPPYIERDAADGDRERYQTVYASATGAVAAPTAGLHFDVPHLARLRSAGVRIEKITLHVGAGTFQPMKTEDLSAHVMHSERFRVSQEVVAAVEQTKNTGGRVVAVGTTVVRSLESAALSGRLCAMESETDLFISPGFRFQVVDMLLTNFHLPKSTLMVLVSAFAGIERIKEAYQHAIARQYRFFSYGDAMLLEGKRAV